MKFFLIFFNFLHTTVSESKVGRTKTTLFRCAFCVRFYNRTIGLTVFIFDEIVTPTLFQADRNEVNVMTLL
jgi:hypothetical protein